MNKFFKNTFGIFAVLSMVLMAAGAAIADTNTLTVSGNVVGTCRFVSATSTLAFGALDPASGLPANTTGSTTFWCTKGVAFALTDDDGLHELVADGNRMQHATTLTEYIPYTLTMTPSAATGSGPSTPITLNLTGDITFANYSDAEAGAYSDTVVITITP
ncbi:MAG: spore coat protein U domain-containing protein [Nitrospiria bacterium]